MDKIIFKNLPFLPTKRQVIFVEGGFDAKLNAFITTHLDELRQGFLQLDKEFYYLPLLTRDRSIEQKLLYVAPYLSRKILACTQIQSSALLQFATNVDINTMGPALIFDPVINSRTQEFCFSVMPLKDVESVEDFMLPFMTEGINPMACAKNAEMRFSSRPQEGPLLAQNSVWQTPDHVEAALTEEACEYAPAPVEHQCAPRKKMRMMCCSKKEDFMRGLMGMLVNDTVDDQRTTHDKPTLEEIEEERMSIAETRRILLELQENVQRLRLEGVSLMAIHEFIDRQEQISPMVITEDYRIFLPAYNNMEIEMGALPKAIYFLFLRYPEGIVCKHMQDYYNELLSIYRQLRPKTDEARLNLTITKVVNPLGNALNENIARIRKAFVEKFDEHLAANYIITGERSQQYSIPLDRNLITWEE